MKTGISIKITDGLAVILCSYGIYLIFQGKTYACLGALTAGAYTWFLPRRARGGPNASSLARWIDRYALNLLVLLLIVSALSDFSRHFSRVDFGTFYGNALLLRKEPARLYDLNRQGEVLHDVSGIKQHYLTFVYPPFVALLFVPFTFVSFRTAYYLMLLCNIALLGLSVVCFKDGLRLRYDQFRGMLLCTAAAIPVYVTLVLGHIAFWGLLLLCMFSSDLLTGRTSRAGFWCGLLSYKVILFPIPFLVLVWLRCWKGLAIACGVIGTLGAISVALVGFDGISANYHALRSPSDVSLLPRMHSLRSLTYFLGMGEWAWIVCSVALVGVLWVGFLRGTNKRFAVAGMILCIMLVAPYLQTYDLTLGLISIALIVSECREMTSSKEKTYVIISFVPVAVTLWAQTVGLSWPIMPVVLLGGYIYCIYRAFSARGRGSEAGVYAA